MSLKSIMDMIKNVLLMLSPSLKKPDSTHGVKEFKELLKGCLTVALFLVKRFKDGVQFDDFTAFYSALTTDEEFKKVLQDAYEGYQLIDDEVKDIDVGEGLEVGVTVIEFVDDFADALKKEEPAADASGDAAADSSDTAVEEKAIDIES